MSAHRNICGFTLLVLSLYPFLCTQMGYEGGRGLSHPVCDLSLLADVTSSSCQVLKEESS